VYVEKGKKMTDNLLEFLRESNAIESVYDEDSLNQAKYAWTHLSIEKEISIGVILKVHKILMLHQPLRPNERGYFREVPVWVGNREGIEKDKIRSAMEKWCERANLMVKHPGSRIEEDINNHHIEYEKIHPFVDGNGRTGRMFLNWQRQQVGLPIFVIKESERFEYYKWFK